MWKGGGVICSDIHLDGLRSITTNVIQELEVQTSRFEPKTF
jgi:hypothetical protein